jgi:hypothetical protein
MRLPREGLVFRRLAFIATVVALLAATGLFLFLFRWRGESGAPPVSRLFVLGRFEDRGPLLLLKRQDKGSCYEARLRGRRRVEATLCPGEGARRAWVGDALLEVGLPAQGPPSVSLAGARFRQGSWIGSGADPHLEDSPDFPFRGYGIPYRAAKVSSCPGLPPRSGAVCIEVADRLGRLSIARGRRGVPVRHNPLQRGNAYRLLPGDTLWLGLVPFTVTLLRPSERDAPVLALERVDRPRSAQAAGRGLVAGRSGDRSWLGRLWPVETTDLAAAGRGKTRPPSYEIYPMAARYEPGNLSRERTNLEGEDIVQRLIDGEWLCLESSNGEPRIVWRSLDLSGCETGTIQRANRAGISEAERRDYVVARFGDAAPFARKLIESSQAQIDSRGGLPAFLFDPTSLPLAFDWRLKRMDDAGDLQPWPVELWGIRFGTARLATFRRPPPPLPEVDLRATTARHVLQLFQDDELITSLSLPQREGAPGAQATLTTGAGFLCLGRGPAGTVPLDVKAGRHHPLGSVFLSGDPTRLQWAREPVSCDGCLLRFEEATAGGSRPLRRSASGSCPADLSGDRTLRTDEHFSIGDGLRLRYVRRGERPWVAMTDQRTGRRVYAEELYDEAGLAPLVGRLSVSGAEAALQQFAASHPEVGRQQLSIDGDLQLAAMSIVRENFRPQGQRPELTAVILDAKTGEVLASVSRRSERDAPRERRFTAWELASRQASIGANTAFLRRSAAGSSFKIVGAYALVNNAMELQSTERGSSLARESQGDGKGGRIALVRDEDQGRPGTARFRQCLGRHGIPVEDTGFVSATFERLFAKSCNNFFVLTGLRFAGPPARLVRAAGSRHPAAGELLAEVHQGEIRAVVLPRREPLADRIRRGLAADVRRGDAQPPRSLYGILFRLGFQPRPGGRHDEDLERAAVSHCAVPDSFGLQTPGGPPVRVPLRNDWFRSHDGRGPELCPGRDFAYPTIPSPGRMDENPSEEIYGGGRLPVRRRPEDGDRPEVHLAQLLIGQGNLGLSALGLSVLYSPAARADGRVVSPCLFREGCGADRAGPQVLATADAGRRGSLQTALGRVLGDYLGDRGTAYNRLRPGDDRGRLQALSRARGWGGKTGTYELVTVSEESLQGPAAALSREEWRDLVAYACGVEGVEPPRVAPGADSALERLVRAGRGAALGALACDAGLSPLHPAGVQGYRTDDLPALLDDLVRQAGGGRQQRRETYHAFVAVSLPSAASGPCRPASGLVIAVLVDDEDDSAVRIGGELALAAERWATVTGRRCR